MNHYISKRVLVVGPRDQYLLFIKKNINAKERKDGTKAFILASKSHDLDEYPPVSSYVRAETQIHGFYIQ